MTAPVAGLYIGFRLPTWLKRQLMEAARQNGRSISEETRARLWASLAEDDRKVAPEGSR